jgi:hypothetical protein
MGKYHSTVDLLFDWFGISCMTIDNICVYLKNRLIQTSQTGGQQYWLHCIMVDCLFIKATLDFGCRSATEILLTVLKTRWNCAFDEQASRWKAISMKRRFDEKALHWKGTPPCIICKLSRNQSVLNMVHRHLRKTDWLLVHTACLVCLVSS